MRSMLFFLLSFFYHSCNAGFVPEIAIAVAPVAASAIPIVTKAVSIFGVAGAALYSLFARNNGHHKSHNSHHAPSSCCSPPLPPDDDKEHKKREDEEFRKKHPHGRYEDVGYHKDYQSGRKSPRPKDGQAALDNSLPIFDKPRARIGTSRDQIVILRETIKGIYHGYVVEWSALSPELQNLLKNAGKVTSRGKII